MRHDPQIQDANNTYPDVRKWEKAFPNYIFNLEPNMGVGTEIVTHFTPSSCTELSHSPIQSCLNTQPYIIPPHSKKHQSNNILV